MTAGAMSGTLLPGGFLADRRTLTLLETLVDAPPDRRRRSLAGWWQGVEAATGPATGIRTIHDRIGAPVFRMLGFRFDAVEFEAATATARLRTPGRTGVGLIERAWADRPPALWRDAAAAARSAGSRWCFVLAPPYLSLVDARGQARRRAIDFRWPHAFMPATAGIFLRLTAASAFDGDPPPIERLLAEAARYEARVGRDLQGGVLRTLADLPEAVTTRRGRTDLAPFDEALTIVFRVLFLLFAESRELVPVRHPVYRQSYSIGALARDALAGDPRGAWEALAAVSRLSRSGCDTDDLIVAPFNGRLFARTTAPSLERRAAGRRDSRSAAIGRALVELGTREAAGGRETIDYGELGVEELGAVYERVLDLEPGRRKQTGTFYTPQPLAAFVVRRTLAPLVEGRTSDEILGLRVVDPAMGSGAFLVAACRFLAEAYEHALVIEGRRAAHDIDDEERASFRRLIAERCLSGVDVNPVAVQLARLSLWLTTLARGEPLSFLDHQLRVGNSLLGASPDDLRRVTTSRRRTSEASALPLFDELTMATSMRAITGGIRRLRQAPVHTLRDARDKESAWARLNDDRSPLATWRLAASLWCARWFWREDDRGRGVERPSDQELRAALDAVLTDETLLPARRLDAWLTRTNGLASRFRFFHWPLEFADAFYDDVGAPLDRPGFDAVIGNPPWEMLRRDGMRGVGNVPSPAAMLRFVRDSGLYRSCRTGHLNLYQPFVDRALDLARTGGRVGLILPWGIATDDGARSLRRRLSDDGTLDVLVGLDNGRGLFPIHRGVRFAVVVARRGGRTEDVRARFGVTTAEAIDELPARDENASEGRLAFPVRLTRETWRRVGGSTGRIPDARSPTDLAWLESLHRRHPRLGDADGWNVGFGRELNATEDRGSFGASGLAVLDGKHIEPFVVHADRSTRRITRARAARLLPDARFERPRLAYRDVSGVGNRRCLIAAVVPAGVVTTHTLFCLRTPIDDERQHFLCAMLNSDVLDAAARMLMGSHLTTSLVGDLPVPVWTGSAEQTRIAALARRLADPATDVNEREAAGRTLEDSVRCEYGLSPPDSAL